MFNWGDGHTTSGLGLSLAHTYAKKGAHTLTVTVTDSTGQTSVVHTTITVGEPLSIKVSGPKSAKHGHASAFRATIADHNLGGKVTHVRWSWGDHKKSTGANVSHKWHKIGKYTITVTVTDNTGVTTRHTQKIKIK